jgi:DNA-binding transcriptional LysR family regulator
MRPSAPCESELDQPRSVITLAQIETFLALVEEGGVARAAERLGVGRSTVSAHAKTISDEFGHHHFRRHQGGQVITRSGIEAYGQLRALLLQATFVFDHFRSGNPRTASVTTVRLPFGFPGCALDRVLEWATQRLTGVCLLPDYSTAAPGDALGFSYLPQDGGAGLVADRWLVIRARPPACAERRTAALAELSGLRLHAPNLPASLQPNLAALADMANASLDASEGSLTEILAEVGKSPKAAVLVPAGLFNPALVDGLLDVTVLEGTPFDPAVRVGGLDNPGIARLLRQELEAALRGLVDQPGARLARPSLPPALPLKYCRSFLALYEEANVGRAAERLSIVQPALTVQLHRIEEELSCSLFARSHSGLSANERADALYRLLRPLIASFAATLRHLRSTADRSEAPIRIGLMPALDDESVMSRGFAVALDRWSRRHADDVLQVMEGYSGTLVRWLQTGAVDFALVDRPFADPDLLIEPVIEDRMAVVIGVDSDLLPPGPVRLQHLADLPLVLPSTRHGLRTLLVQSLHRAGLALQPRLELDSMAGCLNLVKIARYATILPHGSIGESCRRRGVSVHEIVDPQILRTVSLARLRSRTCRPAEASFLDELRLAFSAPHPAAIAATSRDFYGPARQFT